MKLLDFFSLNKLINVFLRIGGMGSKFLVFTGLSKFFSNIEFGNYSLISSIITIMIFVLGLDFYNFSIRDILKTEKSKTIKNQLLSTLVLYLVIYAVFFLIGMVIFNKINYTKNYVFLILFLCITEHFSQELYRLLIGFNKILLANILLFFRTAVWGIYVLFLTYKHTQLSIDFILKIWLISDIITIIIPFVLFVKPKEIKGIKVDISWLKKGLKISGVFLIATVFLKLIEYANRFIVDFFLDKEFVGIYTFYSSIAILITVYINTIVISFELPNILKAKKVEEENILFLKFKKSLFLQTIIISILLIFIIHPVLTWQNKPEFKEYLPILYFMILGVAFMNYSLYYHFKLYVRKFDVEILKTLVYSGIISIVLSILLTYKFGVYGAAIAFTLSGGVLYINRFITVKRLRI